MSPFGIFFIICILLALAWAFRNYTRAQRQRFVRGYNFPARLEQALNKKYPHLSEEQQRRVIAGLRSYFQVCQLAGRRNLAMPSQAVDVAWHEFILFTRLYKEFCRKALGRFLHHVPAEAMSSPETAQKGIKNAWQYACKLEGINPKKPQHLPTLFAIDAELDIPDGFRYVKNCSGKSSGGAYCASHIGCASCSNSGGGCGSSCGGGCGGS